ncbi:Cystathionine gamma-synthase [Golovinomyces cichoracearum]|uniref:cystathionine gamma-synthase n=1 Tax=Golovinomyces cichoracearum TaxID=62708 RepID=A0A420IE31_9PEZI|nr:Cystathionine gamma-synthase [Golovinomyces cichoracearum]
MEACGNGIIIFSRTTNHFHTIDLHYTKQERLLDLSKKEKMSIVPLGEALPTATPHAVSVSLPTWSDNIGYEEGEERVISKLASGYPRFVIHKIITDFAGAILKSYGNPDIQSAMLFPSLRAAQTCSEFILSSDKSISRNELHVIELVLDANKEHPEFLRRISPSISAILFPSRASSISKQYWQHTGDGISSRRAEFCHNLFREKILVGKSTIIHHPNNYLKPCKGPKRYQRESTNIQTANSVQSHLAGEQASQNTSSSPNSEVYESFQFLEERFGRNLDVSLSEFAKSAIRRRIAGLLAGEDKSITEKVSNISNSREVAGLTENDVYLWPSGMSSIFHTHQMMMEARGAFKCILFGFSYVDTLKILEKFGPGCLFYGSGSSEDLDDLETRLKAGEKYLALFCEFPSNPLLKSPDLLRIRELANTYDFAIVIDETVGNFINVNILPHADVLVSSLTKFFSGECNVMGGSSILNPNGRYYNSFKMITDKRFEDNYWPEDVVFMERNSRDFLKRIEKINKNAEAICDILNAHPLVETIYYPKHVSSRNNYEACRTPNGGYGGLLSFRFQKTRQAIAFFDRIELLKGPSLGTNFTLVSPYVILAHYFELEWAAQFGVHIDLIRVSVGIEDQSYLVSKFEDALRFVSDIES